MTHTMTNLRSLARLSALCLAGLIGLGATPYSDPLSVTGLVIYGNAAGATRGAEADVERIYENNPANIRIKDLGLSPTSGHGKKLFAAAKKATDHALAKIAREYDLHVITHLDGVTGGEVDIEDHTDAVIEHLPMFCIDGDILHGNKRASTGVYQLDKQAVLDEIPAYLKWKDLDESDADYFFLQNKYQKQYREALKSVVLEEGANVVVQLGGVTSRGDESPDLTQQVVDALDV